ncbi:type I restriction endonuclease, partial [Acetobacter lambici]|uniref:type I restriction endonuclease n=1 Tax=Acetobacter lambici TaxID=1332824 RepID=UPI0018E95C5E
MAEQMTPIAETNRFIVLDKYVRAWEAADSYQSETDLERELVQDLHNQGYEYRPDLKSTNAMLANVRVQLQALNDVQFTDKEWARFVETYLDRPSDSATDKTRKIHDDYIFDFVFDDGRRLCCKIRVLGVLNPFRGFPLRDSVGDGDSERGEAVEY